MSAPFDGMWMNGWMDGWVEIESHAKYGSYYESTTRGGLVLFGTSKNKTENLKCTIDGWMDEQHSTRNKSDDKSRRTWVNVKGIGIHIGIRICLFVCDSHGRVDEKSGSVLMHM